MIVFQVVIVVLALCFTAVTGEGRYLDPSLDKEPVYWYEDGVKKKAWMSKDEFAIFAADRPKIDKDSFGQNLGTEFTVTQRKGLVTYLKSKKNTKGFLNRIAPYKGLIRPVFYTDREKRRESRMVLSGKIIVQFPNEYSKNKISEIEKEYGLTKSKTFNFSANTFLYTTDPIQSINIANRLSESGKTVYSYPNWLRKFSKKVISDDLFSEQWYLKDSTKSNINVSEVWDTHKASKNEVIAIVDDGLEGGHEDLEGNFMPSLSWDYVDGDSNPDPVTEADKHGTACAGIAAGVGFNTLGITGTAPNGGLVGIRLLGGETDSNTAYALTHKNQEIDIYSNSWGPFDGGHYLVSAGPLVQDAIGGNVTLDGKIVKGGIENGRGGLGSIYVWAAGNGGRNDNSNYDGFANLRYTIAVTASTQYGKQASYSEEGANILLNAPSKDGNMGIFTTDRTGNEGYNTGSLQDHADTNYTKNFGGTSAVAPMVSGVIALMLEANSLLTWRDVQHILIKTSERNAPYDLDWTINGAGYHVNHKYGFGLINAKKAVDTAVSWITADTEISTEFYLDTGISIPDNNSDGVSSDVLIAEDIKIESVEIYFTATDHRRWGDLEISLISPAGTESILAKKHWSEDYDVYHYAYSNWMFASVRHFGESSKGKWHLKVKDCMPGYTGTFQSWFLKIYGTANTVSISPYPASHEFKNEVNSISDVQNFTLSNVGSSEVVLGNALIESSEFSIVNDNCSGKKIPISGSCSLGVIFSPTSPGIKSTYISIPSNPIKIHLSGVSQQPSTLNVGKTGFLYTSIQTAIDNANDGDLVIVHDGIYKELINFEGKAIVVRSKNKHGAIIDGEKNGSVVKFNSSEDSDSVLDGFVIQNGSATNGGGIYCKNASPTIMRCLISGNNAKNYGGGISCYAASPIISKCIIRENHANYGGGVDCLESFPLINNCVLSSNVSKTYAGGIGSFKSSAILINCTVVKNTADYGGGIDSLTSSLTVENCIIWGNSANVNYNEVNTSSDSFVSITYSCINGGYAGNGNIDKIPLFMDFANGSYNLSSSSPCVDTGKTNDLGEDIEGNIRPFPFNGSHDMGAYEYLCPNFVYYGDIDNDGFGDPNSSATTCQTLPPTGYVSNSSDNCPNIYNPKQEDMDSDNIGDICDEDLDGDNVLNNSDNCPNIYNPKQEDLDNDNIGDICDDDLDGDNVLNNSDNCPNIYNPKQEDMDNDNIGDICDDDLDGDNVLNDSDNCPQIYNPKQEDVDNNGIGDACSLCSLDVDGDSVCDDVDNCISVSNYNQADMDNDGVGDACDNTCTSYVPDSYLSITEAVDAAYTGCTIIVRKGIYHENIKFKDKELTVKSEDGYKFTTIDGNNNGSVVSFESVGALSTLDGFTITNGNGTLVGLSKKGGGVYCINSFPTVVNCKIVKNTSTGSGGGFYSKTSSPQIINCDISQNTSDDSGAGIYFVGSFPELYRCSISNNVSGADGGAIFSRNSDIYITNCSILENNADGKFSFGGGLAFHESISTVIHCTVAGNNAEFGGGIYSYNSSIKTVNSIVWNSISLYQGSSIDISYSNIKGGHVGTGNIALNPLFKDISNADYSLSISSPCINKGAPSSVVEYDIDKKPRLTSVGGDGIPDIGSDEFFVSIESSSSSHDFGSVSIGKNSNAVFTIQNKGESQVELTPIYFSVSNPQFAIQEDNCSNSTLAPSKSCTINLVFSPISAGEKKATLEIVSKPPYTRRLNLELSGRSNTYKIGTFAHSGGDILPSTTMVNQGTNQTFTIIPVSCYYVKDVRIDSASVGGVSSYRFVDVKNEHTIEAEFAVYTYTITASARNGGSLSPTSVVECGGDKEFTITPDTGYSIADVKVDGLSIGGVSSYTFLKITENHTIEGIFNKNYPTIESIVPQNQYIGKDVTIYGEYFSQGKNVVEFSTGRVGKIVKESGNYITCTVPSGIPQKGVIKVIVSGLESNSIDFTVEKPVLKGVLPDIGKAGDIISVEGDGFSSILGKNEVLFLTKDGNTLQGVISKVEYGTLTVVVPLDAVSGPLIVVSNGYSTNGWYFTIDEEVKNPAGSPKVPTLGMWGIFILFMLLPNVFFKVLSDKLER